MIEMTANNKKVKKSGNSEKKKRVVVVVKGTFSAKPDITISSANEFESIRGDRPVIHDEVGKFHAIVIDGVTISTPDLDLNYTKLLELVDRGLATGVVPVALMFHDSKHADGKKLSLAHWKMHMESIRSEEGGPEYLSTNWLINTDFKNEKEYLEATHKGYLSKEDMEMGDEKGFLNGPIYYFGLHIGLDAKKSLRALDLGIGDLDLYYYTTKGKFSTRDEAMIAREKGFTKRTEYDDAVSLGCNTKAQYDAIKTHNWPDLATFLRAEKNGFEADESELYHLIVDTPHYQLYCDRIRTHNCGESLDIMRYHWKMVDFQYEAGYDKLWKAEVLDLLRSTKDRRVQYEHIVDIAKRLHPFESGTKAEALKFLLDDDQVNEIGRAIPRDKIFEFLKGRQRKDSIQA